VGEADVSISLQSRFLSSPGMPKPARLDFSHFPASETNTTAASGCSVVESLALSRSISCSVVRTKTYRSHRPKCPAVFVASRM
jgi:hypothetical protein